ncbi:hypothetical protein QBC36DRAFT_347422 [Triangularia setosa]|uniref:Uncharacterized protein n=1 Tax=Triangularia setosa TaxID=2587417 RepID=A0AAN6W439_9PEZI|nr:hypothetical protein QBC36DRAFT_347422 [Podospora setosa]
MAYGSRSRYQHFRREGGWHIFARTYYDIARISGWILQDYSSDAICSRLLGQTTEHETNDKAIETSVDMYASLLAMVEYGKQEDCLARRFTAQTILDARNLKLVKGFMGRSLGRIGGIKVYADFVEEIIRTLALLFPQNDRETKRWLHYQLDSEGRPLDAALAKCGSLWTKERRFECFSFWRDRLIRKEAYDESRPKTMSYGEQWCTFWSTALVFIVTITFGILQIIEGALQVYLSYKALQNGV